jgi:predicted dehydrogenase
MKPIKIAIIGYGKIASDQHVPSIAANPRFQLVATSSRSGEGVEATFTDWRRMLREVEGLEAVAITTPPSVRHEIARECILAGLHVLLEKPPAATLSEIDDLSCLAEAEGVTLFATWHSRHNPAVTAAAQALAGKRIAELQVVWQEDVHKWHPGQQWIWERGGFGVFDPGINALSIATHIFPGPLLLRSAELFVPENRESPIAARLALSSPAAEGELSAYFEWRHSGGEAWDIEIATSDGLELVLREGGARLFVGGREIAERGEPEYAAIYARFVDLIDQRRSLVDLAPLRLTADAFLAGSRTMVEPFDD